MGRLWSLHNQSTPHQNALASTDANATETGPVKVVPLGHFCTEGTPQTAQPALLVARPVRESACELRDEPRPILRPVPRRVLTPEQRLLGIVRVFTVFGILR